MERSTKQKTSKDHSDGAKGELGREKCSASTPKNSRNNTVGTPLRNQNAFKTGKYVTFIDEYLDDGEREFIRQDLPSPLEQLDHQIKIAMVRERMIMKNLAELQAQRDKALAPAESGDIVDNVTKITEKRGKGKNTQVIVERRLLEKIIATQEALTHVQREISRMVEKRHKLMKELDDGSLDKGISVTITKATKEGKDGHLQRG